MMRLWTSSRADSDIVQCATWLEKQQAGLGSEFLSAVDEVLLDITMRPLSCPTLVLENVQFKLPLRWRSIGRFAHIVIFHVGGDEIEVCAVVHPHRDLEALLRERVGVSS